MSAMNTWKIITEPADIAIAREIRYRVFVQEQQVPLALEVDARDLLEDTVHVLMFAGSQPIATGRILPDPTRAHVCHIGRVAVRKEHRKRGVGTQLMHALHAAARQVMPPATTPRIAELSAQQRASAFYASLGYDFTGAPGYYDAGIWHLDMVKPLD